MTQKNNKKKKVSEDQKLLLEIQAGQAYRHMEEDKNREKDLGRLGFIGDVLESFIMKK